MSDYVTKVRIEMPFTKWLEVVRYIGTAAGALECLSWQEGEALNQSQTEASREISVDINEALNALMEAAEKKP